MVSRYSSDRWFHDEHGDLVLWQTPNLPIIVWFLARLLQVFVDSGPSARLLGAVSFGALFTWGWLELSDGDAYIRRLLGLIVLIVIVGARAG